MSKKLLLHTCCAPCAIYVVQQLATEYDLGLYYYNPNIHPANEYQKRLNEIIDWSQQEGIRLIEAEYDVDLWMRAVQGLENEPEGGQRCAVCFQLRLEQTAKYAAANNFDIFATTLTISPHKDATIINKIGAQLADKYEIPFLEADWKKQDGFKIACRLSKQAGFYRQDYCGCIYSKMESLKRKQLKQERYEL